MNWNESEVDREPKGDADGGQFAKGDGGGGSGEVEDGEGGGDVAGVSEWGEAFPQFTGKPAEAIEHLMKEKRGYVPGAFWHEDLGPVDLPWGHGGDDGFGVAHILEQRNYRGEDGETLIRQLPKLFRGGQIIPGGAHSPDRVFIVHKEHGAIISLERRGKKTNWLLTAFYR